MSRLSELNTPEMRARLSKSIEKAQTPSKALIVYEHKSSNFKLLDSAGTIVTFTDYLALVEGCEVVWTVFRGKIPEELARYPYAELAFRPKPECPIPEEEWELDDNGKPNSPMGMAFELPLRTNDERAEILTLKMSTKLGKAAVTKLMNAVNAREKVQRPIISLVTEQRCTRCCGLTPTRTTWRILPCRGISPPRTGTRMAAVRPSRKYRLAHRDSLQHAA